MNEIDKKIVSPSERATYIWNLLKKHFPDLTDWDVTCFAAEFLAMQSNVYLWLEEPIKPVVSLIYTAHYINTETIDAESALKREGGASGNPPKHREAEREPSREPEIDSPRIVKTRFTT